MVDCCEAVFHSRTSKTHLMTITYLPIWISGYLDISIDHSYRSKNIQAQLDLHG